jgi:hypothetical protein
MNQLKVLEADTRRAWRAYRSRTRDLAGEEYEHAERESWDELQDELRRLEGRRQALTRTG